jgi:hypothetical protein
MFQRGDPLLVPYPFTDLSAARRRPVLVICRHAALVVCSGRAMVSRVVINIDAA